MKTAQVVKYFGSYAAIARVLCISRQAVHKWPETVPINRAVKLERLSNGRLRVCQDDYR